MAGNKFSFEEVAGLSTGGDSFVPADRSSKPESSIPRAEELSNPHFSTFRNLERAYKGTRITSLQRSPEKNREVGGKANSQHLTGTAGDFVVPDEHKSSFIADVTKRGYVAIDEGDHVHVQLPKGRRAKTDRSPIAIGGVDDEPKTQRAKFSFDEVMGAGPAKPVGGAGMEEFPVGAKSPEQPAVPELPKTVRAFMADPDVKGALLRFSAPSMFGAAKTALSKAYQRIENRMLTDLGQIAADDPRYTPTRGAADPFAENRDIAARQQRRLKEGEESAKVGLFQTVKNPVELIASDSLPANFVESLNNAPQHEREAFWKVRKVMMQENIVANPERFPAVAVEAAQNAIRQREAKTDPTVREMWRQLKEAAKADPGKTGAVLINALMADPWMLLAPEGIGLRVAAGTKSLVSANAAGKVAVAGDKILDAASTGAALNLGMEAASAASEGRTVTGSEAATAAAMGGGFAGSVRGVTEILKAGAKARTAFSQGKVTQETLEQALKDAAAEEIAAEEVVRTTGPIAKNVKHQIEEATGVKFESDQDLKTYLETARKEWRQLFKDRDLNGQYQAALAQERLDRAAVLKADAEKNAANAETEAAARREREIEAAYSETASQRASRLDEEWRAALAARDEADLEGAQTSAIREDQLRYIAGEASKEEIFAAALEEDLPAVKRAMAKAVARDAHLARPKWQRGEADPKVLARLGVGGIFAGTAFAVAPEEQKLQTSLAAGLAGLLIPGGGSVLSRMRQAGAISPEGDIIGLLVKQGKMLPDEDAAQLKIRQAEIIKRARDGDQAAMRDLFNEEYPKVQRTVKKFLVSNGARLGVDAEDVAQDAMIKAFQNLESFREGENLSAWLYGVASNEAKMALRSAKAAKRGRYETESMYSQLDDEGEFAEGVSSEVEVAASTLDTPEGAAIRRDTEVILKQAIESLPEEDRLAYLLQKVELYDTNTIAEMMGWTQGQTLQRLSRADAKVQDRIARGFKAVPKTSAGKSAVPETAQGEAAQVDGQVKRGRGRPPGSKNKQKGEVDPKMLKTLAVLGIGGTAGAMYADENKGIGAIGGAGLGALLFGGGAAGAKALVKGTDYAMGASSTRILNYSKAIHKKILTTERRILEQTHRHIANVDPFLVRLNKLPKDTQDLMARALMTGKGAVIDKMMKALNDAELTAGYKNVRASLDELGDKLVNLKRFSRGNIEYFPRIVTDKEGLFKAIGKIESGKIAEVLEKANADSLRKNGRPLGDIEESAIINQMLFADKRSIQPGFTKARGIEEITPELQQYYASPTESLHSYIRAAVQDLEAATFFGTHTRNMKRGNYEYIDVEQSVNNLIADEVKAGTLSQEAAEEISSILKTRFKEGLRAEADIIRNIKNVGNIGLLGNFWSAGTQLADVGVQVYTQGLFPTIKSIVRQLTGSKIVDMRDFGLADHIAEEFAGQLRTSRWVNKVFKGSLFAGIDRFGKNTALNAAVIKARSLVQTEKGLLRIANKYQESFGEDFPKLVSELKSGKISDLTRDYAFMELSRTQPISRIEMPEMYLKHPNARSYLWLKSFMMKQFDVARRDAYNEIKAGNVAKGIKNLVSYSVVLGLSGAGTEAVKEWLLGRDVKFEASDIYLNALKTFGMSQYFMDEFTGISKEEAAARREAGQKYARQKDATPVMAVINSFIPPARMFDDILRGDPAAVRYLVPGLGPYLAEKVKNAAEVEREAKREQY